MINIDRPTHYYVAIGLIVMTGITGIASITAEAANIEIEKASITGIKIELADDNFAQFDFSLSKQLIAEQVSKNLTEQKFPITLTDSNTTHTLKAKLDKIDYQKPPVGLSFSNGNADPRSADFQKTEVLPITCQLNKIGSNTALIERKMTFSTQSFFSHSNPSQLLEKLADQISTTCFNLLDELKLPSPDKQANTTLSKPTWMPSVQVVVKSIPVPVNSASTLNIIRQSTDTEDKELIINNQGSPLTLHMGVDRR